MVRSSGKYYLFALLLVGSLLAPELLAPSVRPQEKSDLPERQEAVTPELNKRIEREISGHRKNQFQIALAEQLAMLKRKGRQHPFYWASFIQSGELANLEGQR